MPDPSEQELLRLARKGNRAAFGRLQQRLEGPVRRFAQRLVGQDHDADDVVQDAFIALYIHLKDLRSVSKLRPFLFRITRNRCYDELRRQRRFEGVPLADQLATADAVLHAATAVAEQPDRMAEWVWLLTEVRRAIDRLPELQRQAMILYVEEGWTYAEIAEAMSTSIGTVKSRIHHARRKLRRLLEPETLAALGVTAPRQRRASKTRPTDSLTDKAKKGEHSGC